MPPLTPTPHLIPEKNLIVFSPHYDDVLFMLGAYAGAMNGQKSQARKNWTIQLIFSRSNYQCKSGAENRDTSLERIKRTTGKRLLEDTNCLNELLGRYAYRYEVYGEDECLIRGKQLEATGMEFPHGTYPDFTPLDYAIKDRLQLRIRDWATRPDTALIFPLGIREHIDHFILREAAANVMHERDWPASFYFAEDKPYAGLADATEWERANNFIDQHQLSALTYRADQEQVIDLAFRHYVSQVEPIYAEGIRKRSQALAKAFPDISGDFDRLYRFKA